MYREILLEEYKHPKNKFKMLDPHCEHCEHNKLCGDQITIYLKLDNSKKIVEDVSFLGCGCVISQAAASMFTQHIKGKLITEIERMDEKTVLDLLGIPLNPMRMKCAILIMKTTAEAIKKLKCTHANICKDSKCELSGE